MGQQSERSRHIHLAAIFKRKRERSGLSQQQVAEKLGVTQSWVSNVEKGARRLDLVEGSALAKAIGTSLIEIVAEWEGTDLES
ncbi:helix-turn-helix domain-containing protein [Cryobacterium sp. Y11]|uniref:helix-turn-helix domain-containing protein n=1 Tax=Cryobacterium sp. Y11 TaxID=2045016 RepID=UPI000CE52D35|nr:helix-turn-helix transcriptional regulator [Cryobacterium sp. Y11]